MDQLKNFANKLGSGSNTNTNAAPVEGHVPAEGSAAPAGTTTTTTGGQQDYLDKGLMAAQKKMGYNGNQETNEKVTDFARGQFEKASGKKVPDKFSN